MYPSRQHLFQWNIFIFQNAPLVGICKEEKVSDTNNSYYQLRVEFYSTCSKDLHIKRPNWREILFTVVIIVEEINAVAYTYSNGVGSLKMHKVYKKNKDAVLYFHQVLTIKFGFPFFTFTVQHAISLIKYCSCLVDCATYYAAVVRSFVHFTGCWLRTKESARADWFTFISRVAEIFTCKISKSLSSKVIKYLYCFVTWIY